MSKRETTVCDYREFGNALLETEDLDPLYCTLTRAQIPQDMLKRWLLSYFCFYHAGVCSYIAEQPRDDFYSLLLQGIADKWPHGAERRHFRGQAAVDAITGLKQFGEPEKVVDYMTQHDTAHDIMKHVQTFYLFGPWISWKVSDMAERVLELPVSFDDTSLFMYRDPVMGAALWFKGDKNAKVSEDEVSCVVEEWQSVFGGYKAPPTYDRQVNIQEIETVLCKWKSNAGGSYPLGKDSKEIYHGLDGWGDLAEELRKYVPSASGDDRS
jgi:hypothetical protein